MWWIIGAVLGTVIVFDSWHDPRKLRIGVTLVFFLNWILFTIIGLIMRTSTDEAITLVWIILGVMAVGSISVLLLGLFNIVNGITMLRRESRSFANMLSLIFGLALVGMLAYVAAVLLLDPVSPQVAFELFRWLLFAAFPIAYLAFAFLAFFSQSMLYGWLTPSVTRNADAVIVLGAGLRNGEVTPLLAARLDRAKQAFERIRNPEAVLIVSGGQGADEPHPEAQAMAAYLREAGADPERLWQENQSRTTEENLTLSTELLDQRGRSNPRCIVVTNNYHVFRAALLMRKLGLRGHAVGAPTAPYYWPSAFLREYVAILRDHKYVTAVALILACIPLIFMVVSQILSLFT